MKPSRALLALVAGLFALALLLGALPALGVDLPAQLQPLWWGLLCALVLLALLDAIWLRRLPSPRLERALPGNLALGRWSDVRLTLHHGYQRSLIVDVFDQVPAAMDFEPLPQQVALHPGDLESPEVPRAVERVMSRGSGIAYADVFGVPRPR